MTTDDAMPANGQIMIDQDREQRARRLARKLAEWDRYEWRHGRAPLTRYQQEKQDTYLARGRELLEMSEWISE